MTLAPAQKQAKNTPNINILTSLDIYASVITETENIGLHNQTEEGKTMGSSTAVTHRYTPLIETGLLHKGGIINVGNKSSDALEIFKGFPPTSGEVVAQIAFGGNKFYEAAREQMGANWPMMWLQGDVCSGKHVTGMQAFSITQPVRRVVVGNRVVGSAWEDENATYCLLAGILPTDLSVSRGQQTSNVLETIDTTLQQVGMDFTNVARTWFFNDQLLQWYGEFNQSRTSFFEQKGIFCRLIPASTGIGASNPSGAALVAGALAVRPKNEDVVICEVSSPLQCAATAYRSSFSRAVEIGSPNHRLLMISGTASIAPDGKSQYPDDVEKQIHLTLDVVEAILQSRDMDWHNTTRAIGYFRSLDAVPVFEACCQTRGIPSLPMISAHTTVCREDLLFELELDAMTSVGF